MSAVEETKESVRVKPAAKARPQTESSWLVRFLDTLSSVRLGVLLLGVLVALSMAGMLIQQQEVDGFDKYYHALTPAQQLVYGKLGLFDIYHAWYFNALLLVLSLNIVLASIDRFPKAWTFVSRPKLDASAAWLRGQQAHDSFTLHAPNRASLVTQIVEACRRVGLKRPIVTEKGGRTFVFAQKNVWNRLGAYAVHVALLTIFAGGFLTAQFGRTGQMPLKPGLSSSEMNETVFNLDEPGRRSVSLPFEVICTDAQQKLIKNDGPITADNTIDWMTTIKIKDGGQETREAVVHMNHPYDYRGYRFFMMSTIPVGRARRIKLSLTPVEGGAAGAAPQEVEIARDGSATLPDGTLIKFVEFLPDFTIVGSNPTTASADYNNPAAVLSVTPAGGRAERAFAFAERLPDGVPIAAPVGGYQYHLAEYEKVSDQHVLSVQRDPGATVFYVGGALLALTLASVFFFSHQRFWALVEEGDAGNFSVTLGANANRNLPALEDRFKKLTESIQQPEPTGEVQSS